MDSRSLTIIAWSYGLAGVGYAAYALRLWALGQPWRQGRAALYILAAVIITSAWGITGLAFTFTESNVAIALGLGFDMLRYAAWSGFLLTLIKPRTANAANAGDSTNALTPIAVLLVVSGVLIHLGMFAGLQATAETQVMLKFARVAGRLLGTPPLQRLLKAAIRRAPRGPSAEQRASARSHLWGEARDFERTVVSRLNAPESYALSETLR